MTVLLSWPGPRGPPGGPSPDGRRRPPDLDMSGGRPALRPGWFTSRTRGRPSCQRACRAMVAAAPAVPRN